jgi:hypothetical protein
MASDAQGVEGEAVGAFGVEGEEDWADGWIKHGSASVNGVVKRRFWVLCKQCR